MAAIQSTCTLVSVQQSLSSNANHERTSLGHGSLELKPAGSLPFKAKISSSVRAANVRCMAVAEVSAPALDPQLQDDLKREVARKAVELIQSNTVVAMGTGSTSCIAIEEFGKLLAQGKLKNVELLVTSFQAGVIARQNNIKTTDLNSVNRIDLAIDGADEVDADMNMIKGGGAAHTLEKVANTVAKETVIIVDQSKIVPKLGTAFPVPVEVLPQAVAPVLRSLAALGGVPEIRAALMKDGAVITDLGNMVVDVRFPGGIDDPKALEIAINNIPGVVENGLFCSGVSKVLVSTKDGDQIEVVELDKFVKSLKSL